ncbi:DUF6233 domain-containing protein [Streptomyces sp. NPDC037389]|uniref:DUF6233 domain-containing protein n=1 Tax=Streptomyces sp. NPDC037389 TaxID=3155369 RepID=UPI0033C9AC80
MDGQFQGEMPKRTPTPQIRVRLHDGQEVLGHLLRRWQAVDGTWFYEVTLTFWAHAIIRGKDTAEPADIVFSVPASHVAPVPEEAQAYKRVPVRRHPAAIARARTGRRRPTTPPAPLPARETTASEGSGTGWPQVRGDGSDRWKITYPRHPYNATGPRPSVLHHASCFTAQGTADLTTDQALEALSRPGAQACEMCGADQLAPPPDASARPGERRGPARP